MDDARPIAIISLGVERDIMFRQILSPTCSCCRAKRDESHKMSCYVRDSWKTNFTQIEKQKLGHGSLCLMAPGMQDTWQHRIPKAGFQCGERISLTFRGYIQP
jgi:alkylated DNA repair dioxygenase AlkB